MLDKIPLEQIYLASYVADKVEYVYNNSIHSVSIIHHFDVKNKQNAFLYLKNSNNEFVGYMNINNKRIYEEKMILLDDYELVYKYFDEENIKNAAKTNSGYINFEPLKNYNSKYIKPIMTLKQIKKAVNDINKQKIKEVIKIKKMHRLD